MANEAEQAIYTRLASAPTFHPATADIFATDWGLDAGDVVAVRSGNDTYNVPVYNMSLNWKGNSRVQIQSTGNETRKPLSALKRKQFSGGRGAYENEKELQRFHADLVQAESDLGAKIGLVVTETDDGGNVVNAASIVAGINSQDKGSESYVDIQAQYINLTGYVRASEIDADIATIRQLKSESGYAGSLRVAGALSSNTFQASNITGSTISASNFAIAGDPNTSLSLKTITLPRSGGYNTLSVLGYGDAINFPNCIVSASVDETTNTLTLTPLVGTPINFSKAASPENGTITNIVQSAAASYTPTASGGYYTVHASASGTNLTNAGNKYDKDLIVMATAAYQAGKASISLQDKSFTTNGTKTPDTGYDGFSSVTINVPQTVTANGTITDIAKYGDPTYQSSGNNHYYTVATRAYGTNLTNTGNYFEKNITVNASDAYQDGFTEGRKSTAVLQTKSFTTNGTKTPDSGYDGFSSVTVNVPQTTANLQTKTFNTNGTKTPDSGYDGFSKVTVNVPTAGDSISISHDSGTKTTLGGQYSIKEGYRYTFTFTCGEVSTRRTFKGVAA